MNAAPPAKPASVSLWEPSAILTRRDVAHTAIPTNGARNVNRTVDMYRTADTNRAVNANRRKTLMLLGSFLTGSLFTAKSKWLEYTVPYDVAKRAESLAKAQQEKVHISVEAELSKMRQRYPHLNKKEEDYDRNLRQKISGQGRNPSESVLNSANANLGPKITNVVKCLCDSFRLDPKIMLGLIMVESSGNPDAVSDKGAQGLMQLLPETMNDFVKRFRLYSPVLRRIRPNLLKLLETEEAKQAVKLFTNPTATNEQKIQVLESLGKDLENQELNMIFWHVYFTVLRNQIALQIREKQASIAKMYQDFTDADLTKYSKCRNRGISSCSIDFIRGKHTYLVRTDAEYATYAETLAQYNGGNSPKKESYGYAAVIQVQLS